MVTQPAGQPLDLEAIQARANAAMSPRERANARVRALLDTGDHEGACAVAEAFEASEAYDVTHPRA